MTAFAIYSNDDKKLIFYKRVISSLPKIGSKYMGRTVSGIRKNAESSIDEIQDVSFTKDKVWGINFKDTYCPTNTSHWFDGFSGMDVPNGLAKIDTSQVTNMSYMFYGCNNMKFFFVNWWDTSKVTDMSYMFGRCYWMALETGWNLQFWDTSNVKNMEGMFIFCSYCSTLTIEHWNTSKVENMYMMFWGCKSIYKLDLSKWNVANVTDHSYFKETESDIVEPNWVS